MKSQLAFERAIKKLVVENCDNNSYADKFSPDFQNIIKENSTTIAKITMEDENLKKHLEDSIEESIRIMILREGE